MSTTTKFLLADGAIGDDSSITVKALPVEILPDEVYSYFTKTVDIPTNALSIFSISVFYRRQHAGNLYLRFSTSYINVDLAGAPTIDVDNYATYAGGGTDGAIASHTIPSTAYDGLGTIDPGDILGIAVERDASHASDTYTSDLQIVGIQIVFTTSIDISVSPSEYCNATTDLYRIYPRLEEYKSEKGLRGWIVHSGSVYKLAGVGYGDQLLENGVAMTAVASAATVNGAGKYYYDSTNDIIYCWVTTGTPNDVTNVMKWGEAWGTLKTWAIREASARIDGTLDGKFPVPIPENPHGSSTQKWDNPLVNATAYIACALIVGRKEPQEYDGEGTPKNLAARLYSNGLGIINQYSEGKLRFSWEISRDELGGYNIIATSTNTSVGMFQLRGEYLGSDDDIWMLKISTGGALGTAQYQISYDNGTTYQTAVTTSITWASLGNGIDIRFFDRGGAASSFIANDTWQIVISGKDNAITRGRLGSISLIG